MYNIEKIVGYTVEPSTGRYERARASYSKLNIGHVSSLGDFPMEPKIKQRICIEFCVKLQKTATETLEMINTAFPNEALKRTTIFEWYSIRDLKMGE